MQRHFMCGMDGILKETVRNKTVKGGLPMRHLGKTCSSELNLYENT